MGLQCDLTKVFGNHCDEETGVDWRAVTENKQRVQTCGWGPGIPHTAREDESPALYYQRNTVNQAYGIWRQAHKMAGRGTLDTPAANLRNH